MKKLVVFIGESGSGKTTLIAELAKKYSDRFKRVVTCTSRTPRAGEVDGVDYHFLPEEYFVNNPDLVLVKKTEAGDYYGTRKTDLRSDTHHLLLTLRPFGVNKLINRNIENLLVVRISITKDLKTERMRQRGDTEEMITSRIRRDARERYHRVEWEHIPVIELEAVETLDEKVKRILRAC